MFNYNSKNKKIIFFSLYNDGIKIDCLLEIKIVKILLFLNIFHFFN